MQHLQGGGEIETEIEIEREEERERESVLLSESVCRRESDIERKRKS